VGGVGAASPEGVTMNRRQLAVVVAGFMAFIAGCDTGAIGKKPLPYTAFVFHLDEGVGVISDDYYLTNNSSHDLEDVHITFTATGVNGDRKSLQQFWAYWAKGEKKMASAKVADGQTVHNVQKIEVSGYSSEYSFGFEVSYKK
jgi:hypothetical protein